MTLPEAANAVIEPPKVRDYLLAGDHPVGRFKARFFRALGYSVDEWEVLLDDLRSVAETGVVALGRPSEYGQKYEVRGTIQGPNQKTAAILIVWIVRTHETFPRFVTAHPLEST